LLAVIWLLFDNSQPDHNCLKSNPEYRPERPHNSQRKQWSPI